MTRVLPPAEWPQLAATPLADVWPYLDPMRTRIIVSERGGRIVGHLVLMLALHAEFLWVSPELRAKVSVIRRLREQMFIEARTWRAPTILMAALCHRMRRILTRLGARRLPGTHYVLWLKGAK